MGQGDIVFQGGTAFIEGDKPGILQPLDGDQFQTLLNATIDAAVIPIDPVHFDDTRARALKAGLARVKLGTGRLDVLMLGDSWIEGAGATTKDARLLSRLQALLRQSFQTAGVAGGAGYVPGSQNTSLAWPAAYTFTGTNYDADHTGIGRRARALQPGATMTITADATSFRIAFERAANRGTFTWSVDGGTEKWIDTAGASTSGRTTSTGPLTPGTHTLRITAVNQVVIEGIELLNGDETKGVHVWEAGRYGWSVGRMMAAPLWLTALPDLVAPDVIISTFGINDYQFTGWIVTPAQFETNYRALLDGVRARLTKPVSWFIFIPSEPLASANNPEPWSAYRDVLLDLAEEYGIGVIDAGAALGDVKTKGAYDIGSGDGYHLSNVGHEMAARHVFANLTARADYT